MSADRWGALATHPEAQASLTGVSFARFGRRSRGSLHCYTVGWPTERLTRLQLARTSEALRSI